MSEIKNDSARPRYAGGGHNPLFKCVVVAKVGQGRPKSIDCGGSLTSSILPGQVLLMFVDLSVNFCSRNKKPYSRNSHGGSTEHNGFLSCTELSQ